MFVESKEETENFWYYVILIGVMILATFVLLQDA